MTNKFYIYYFLKWSANWIIQLSASPYYTQ